MLEEERSLKYSIYIYVATVKNNFPSTKMWGAYIFLTFHFLIIHLNRSFSRLYLNKQPENIALDFSSIWKPSCVQWYYHSCFY